jgi:hypothetical protein
MCSHWAFDVRGHVAADDSQLEKQNKRPSVLTSCKRGAKAAMAVALRSPETVSALIPVDNAPVNAALASDFPKYVRGMQKIEAEKVTKQSDADKILADYEEVCQLAFLWIPRRWGSSRSLQSPSVIRHILNLFSLFRSASSSSPT